MIDIRVKLRGRYKLEAVKADGSRRLLADWFDNLITDTGLDKLAQTSNWGISCFVGSGNTAPANANTSLVSLVASATNITTSSNTNSGSSPYIGTASKTFRFAIGTATGNLSEVGVGDTATSLFSRALILDGLGAPTTITVLSTEALDVTYQLLTYVPLTDVTGSVTINAVAYAYVLRAANAASASVWSISAFGEVAGVQSFQVSNGAIAAITSQPSGALLSAGTTVPNSYTSGTHFLDTVCSFGLTDGNVSGGLITAAFFTCGRARSTFGQFQVSFTPGLPKDASHTMTLTFRHSWARH